MKDPYSILGVKKDDTDETIKSAFRKLAKQHHPDAGGDSEKFKEINTAYDLIKTADKRNQFESTSHFRPNTGNQTYHDFDAFFTDPVFRDIFAQATGFSHTRRPRNSNIRVRISITLESILTEQTRTIQVNTGSQPQALEIKIPAGIHDGAVITYRGQGQRTYNDQPPGDLMVEINIEPNARFERVHENLHSQITIDCFLATLGTTIDFTTIRDKKIRVHIPAGSQHGTVLRIPNEGLPSINRPKINGHQFIRVNIAIPTNLTNEQLAFLDEIVNLSKGMNNAS